jgi:protein Tex
MNHAEYLAHQLILKTDQVSKTIELLDAGNTIPFLARYRKEVTGSLDEEQIRQINAGVQKLRSLDERRETVLHSIREQNKLTPELEKSILKAETLTALEDLYQPYKPKRKTRASVAREKGLQPLAELIIKQDHTNKKLDDLVKQFITQGVTTPEEAWAGARDIVAEIISDHAEVRRLTREKALQWATIYSQKIESAQDERSVYENYYDFELPVNKLRPHQVLAINRGEAEKALRVKVVIAERDWQNAVVSFFRPDRLSPLAHQMEEAIADAAERLLLPAIERDVRRELSEKAESHAITIFAKNLRALLNQPPLAGHTILGIDPGFRTGCKVAVVDPTGRLLDIATIYPHEPQREKERSLKILAALVIKHQVTVITIGNGTASRETEQLIAELINTHTPKVKYLIVNEAGASVYSASPLAKKEFPDLDISMRGAVSIARRAQDPLAELVKIEPRSIGVGLYQHDIDQKQLSSSLESVVESVVNQVGVEISTASPALLTYVSGIGPKLAGKIVQFRNENGPFHNRENLKKVQGMGTKVYEQSAGFLRIRDGDNPLDASAIHPESYQAAQAILEKANTTLIAPSSERQSAIETLLHKQSIEALAKELVIGVPTLSDILEQIVRPGRDPRHDAPEPLLRSDVLSMDDLSPGMKMKGTVRNVVDFGVFIDIGVKQDGLLHRSQIPPDSKLKVGDVIEVCIQKIEQDRGRISLGWVD